jgi:GNAT superfamily N-acetyltransferase
MFWRVEPEEYEAAFRERSLTGTSGGPNKERMAELVAGGTVPGLLAYRDGSAVGWASTSPRSELVRVARSRQLLAGDDPEQTDVWSIACFYVHRSAWRTGVATALLAAAIEHAREHGAGAIEGYPVKPGSVDPYTGYDAMFARAGFRLVRAGRGRGRALWRRGLSG